MLELKNINQKARIQLEWFVSFILTLALFSISCNSEKGAKKQEGGFQLNGTINGFSGEIKASTNYGENVLGNIDVKDGQFSFSHDIPVPTEFSLETEDGSVYIRFWAENSKMTLNATKVATPYGDIYEAEITGGIFQKGADEYAEAVKEYRKTHPSEFELQDKMYAPNITDEEKKKLEEEIEKSKKDYIQFQKDFIKNNPTNPYGAELIYVRLTTKSGGESARELKTWADPIDPSIKNHPHVQMMFDVLNSMLETEAGLDKFVAGVHNVKYKVDKSYNGHVHKNVIYLALLNNDNICTLSSEFGIHDEYNSHGTDGNQRVNEFYVQIINPDGDEVNKFTIKEDGLASSIAADEDNNIYVLTTLTKEIEEKYRGRTMKYMKKVGVKCYVYNVQGVKIREFLLSERECATGARIYKDKLLVSDVGTGKLGIYNKEDGKLLSTIEDLRPCCSILDFDIDNNTGQILAANLGSFRVDGYDLTGKKIVSFGQRGRTLDDFHSCCNPVSVRKLNSGAVITVEKEPTRIKVYSQEGAKSVEGIEELVEGCFHIPMMSDSKDNIYLASPEKGLVKCVVV